MVTLIGFAWPILNLVLCAWFNPNLDPSVHLPPWVYLSLGVGLFFYQTMDGVRLDSACLPVLVAAIGAG